MRNQTIKNESAVRHQNVFSIDAAARNERKKFIYTHALIAEFNIS